MKVEVLYFSGCPNHPAAVSLVRNVLQQEEAAADLVEIAIADVAAAQATGFLGSPSIRVDGQDVERSARSLQGFGMSCRTYVESGYRSGVPPAEWIRAAVHEAKLAEQR